MKTAKKKPQTRKSESRKLREMKSLLEHASELIYTLSKQIDASNDMAVIAFYQQRNNVLKGGR